MQKVIVKSFRDCVNYYLNNKDTDYIIISIQNTPNGFGRTFKPKGRCIDVLTLLFDDVEYNQAGYVLMNKEHAKQIAKFIRKYNNIGTCIVHCEFGQSRSVGVGKAISEQYNAELIIENRPVMNRHVYNLVKQELNKKSILKW